MAGHSHWAGIKHKKAANDAKKGKVFSKLSKLIYGAVKEGGSGKPEDNPRLRLVLEKARQANMPKDNVQRAIQKATDTKEGYTSMVLEGYAAGGIAVVAECVTDNTNRTGSEVRSIFERNGGKVGTPGCVTYMFERKGVYHVEKDAVAEETLMEIALESEAEDVVDQGEFFEVTTAPGNFVQMGEALERAGVPTTEGEVQLLPNNVVEVDEQTARKVLALSDALEEHEDVSSVYTNADVSEEVAGALGSG